MEKKRNRNAALYGNNLKNETPKNEMVGGGANNLAKALYRKENKDLIGTINRYTDGLIFSMQMQEIAETLSAAKAPKKDGKGNPYADRWNHHMPLFQAMQAVSRKAFKRAFG